MWKPRPKTATKDLVKLSTYTRTRLAAKAETKDLEPPLKDAEDRMVEADDSFEQVEQTVQGAMARRDVADGDADDLLGRLYHDLRGLEPGRRLGPMGQQLFPKGLQAVTHSKVRDQPGEMRILAGKVNAIADTRIAGYAQAIVDKAQALDDKVGEYETTLEQAGVAFGDLLRARMDWIRLYEKTYGELVARLGKAQAEKFFKKAKRRKRTATPA